jgi:hypothetical protein
MASWSAGRQDEEGRIHGGADGRNASGSALILKSGTINDAWEDPESGLCGTASAQDISHAIVCTK